jgi:1-acyl-sn-glycerol-3-phosphate acyltransferase
MFIGIGTLIFAKHPALHSLAEVTIVGMFSVVLMAYVFPPLIYKWLISKKDGYRERPISLAAFGVTAYCAVVFFTQLFSVYVLGGILFGLLKPNSRTKRFFHEYVRRCFWFDMNHIAGVKFTYENKYEETFSDPAIVICNHQSMLDTAYLMAVSSKISIVANEHASQNRIIRKVFKWLDFYTIPDGGTIDDSRIRQLVSQGYSVLIFPEGERNPSSSVMRFHKGAFCLAEKCGLDIVPNRHGSRVRIRHFFDRNLGLCANACKQDAC